MVVGNNLLWHVQKIPFVPIRLARPRILHEPKHFILGRKGTNDHEHPRSVPLVPMCSLVGVSTFRTVPQSHFGDKPVKFQVVCPQNGTAVLKGLRHILIAGCHGLLVLDTLEFHLFHPLGSSHPVRWPFTGFPWSFNPVRCHRKHPYPVASAHIISPSILRNKNG